MYRPYRPGFDPDAVKLTLEWVSFMRKQAALKGGTWIQAYHRVFQHAKRALS